jgi:hypothetical protein
MFVARTTRFKAMRTFEPLIVCDARSSTIPQQQTVICLLLDQRDHAIGRHSYRQRPTITGSALIATISDGAIGMTVDTNSTALEQPLIVRSGVFAADIRTISDAAKFIRSLPADYAGRLHWQLASAVLEAADRNPGNADLLRTATLALKNALTTEGMLAPQIDLQPLVTAWKNRRSMLTTQLEWLESGQMRTGTNISDATTQQDITRLRGWIAELEELIAENSK